MPPLSATLLLRHNCCAHVASRCGASTVEHLCAPPTDVCGCAQINEYITTIEVRFDLNLTFMRICQMVLNLLFLAHMLGCFWFYMAVLVGCAALHLASARLTRHSTA